MGFATVKSDPYKAGLRPRRRRRALWTSEQWRRLVRRAQRDDGTFDPRKYPLSAGCLDLIREFNASLGEG